MSLKRVLVVGTTSDYIELLRQVNPGQLLFVTAHDSRKLALEPCPAPDEEILCDLSDPEMVLGQLRQHIKNHGLSLSGITCFDCESMELTARIAEAMSLAYPALEGIQNCRNKSRSKELWMANNVPCPRYRRVQSRDDVADFFQVVASPCVFKPVDGSGSERVFRANTLSECLLAYDAVCDGRHSPIALMEEYVQGTEYSCDFIIDHGRVDLIRLTRKIHAKGSVFGTIMAYDMIDFLPENISRKYFLTLLGNAAQALSVKRAICMVDFIIQGDDIRFLELAPRPGGDCLPWLIRWSLGIDMLKLAVDFAKNRAFAFKKPQHDSPHVGLRLHAGKAGVLRSMDTSRVLEDPRVKEVLEKHTRGHKISLPPKDYDSWNLGHIIFKPVGIVSHEAQCRELLSLVSIEIDHDTSHKPRPLSKTHKRHGSKALPFARKKAARLCQSPV